MKHDNVKYGILLSREQLDFLKDDRQGFHRPKALDTFLSLAAMEPFRYEKKNFSADLGIGQFAISKVELAGLWGCDRKTAQKMVDLFNEAGILSSVSNNRTTIHTVLCLAFWFVDGRKEPIRNPHYRRNPDCKNGEDGTNASRHMHPAGNAMQPVSSGNTVHDTDASSDKAAGQKSAVCTTADNQKAEVGIAYPPDVQGDAIAEPLCDNGSSRHSLHSLPDSFSSVVDADNDEREEEMPSSPSGYGQLPEDSPERPYKQFADNTVEASAPFGHSESMPSACSPAMYGETHKTDGTVSATAHSISTPPPVTGEDTSGKPEMSLPSPESD